MLLKINDKQKVFVEITNIVHGGLSWELGTCLWSPARDKGKSRAWKLMEDVEPDDIIIHIVKEKNKYNWYGTSIANSKLKETEIEPQEPAQWKEMKLYQRIELTQFTKLNQSVLIQIFFDRYKVQLLDLLNNDKTGGQFYCTKKKNNEDNLQMNQRYFARCSKSLYSLFDDFSNLIDFNVYESKSELIPTFHEPQNPDFNPPGRVDTIVSRVLRDTRLSRTIKAENQWTCQICGTKICLPNQNLYNEGHHLKPLGGEHAGPDVGENIIVLCPTHHVEFDFGCITIDPKTQNILHIDPHNKYHNQKVAYYRDDLDVQFLRYHHQNRFNKN